MKDIITGQELPDKENIGRGVRTFNVDVNKNITANVTLYKGNRPGVDIGGAGYVKALEAILDDAKSRLLPREVTTAPTVTEVVKIEGTEEVPLVPSAGTPAANATLKEEPKSGVSIDPAAAKAAEEASRNSPTGSATLPKEAVTSKQ